jgi:hypothetical protein
MMRQSRRIRPGRKEMGLVVGHAGVEAGGVEVEAVVSEGAGEEVVDSEGLAEEFLVGLALALTRQNACAVSRLSQDSTLHVSHEFLDIVKAGQFAERTGRGRSIEHYATFEMLKNICSNFGNTPRGA